METIDLVNTLYSKSMDENDEVWHIFGNDFKLKVINTLPSFVAVAVIAS